MVSQADKNSFLESLLENQSDPEILFQETYPGAKFTGEVKIAVENLKDCGKIVIWNGLEDLEMVMVEVLGKLPRNFEISVLNCAMKYQSKKMVNWLRKLSLRPDIELDCLKRALLNDNAPCLEHLLKARLKYFQ